MRKTDDDSPVTYGESLELLNYHALRASVHARHGSPEAAQAHGSAALAMAALAERLMAEADAQEFGVGDHRHRVHGS